MKINFTKSIIASMAMLFFMGGSTNAQNKQCLRDITSEIEGDYTYYGYNKDNKLDSVYQYLGYYDEDSYRLYKYDDKGNMIKEVGYGILPNDYSAKKYSKVFEVFYGFDEQNRLVERKNFNIDEFSANLDFYLGGIYTYQYDGNGLLTERKLYWDEKKDMLAETTKYNYDENNRLAKEIHISNGFYGETEDLHIEYYYDENGNLTNQVIKTLIDSGAMEESGRIIYEYDANGNLIKRTTYDNINPKIPSQQHILLYNDNLAEDVAYPINYEDEMDFFTKSKHTAVTDSIYMRDVENVLFLLFDVQNWHYSDIDNTTGIESVINPQATVAFTRDNNGNIVINGIDASEYVRIYDVNGKIVRSEMYNGRVNINNLPKGMYILMTRNGNMKFTR